MSRFLTPEDCNQKREKLHELLPLTNGPFCVRFMVTNDPGCMQFQMLLLSAGRTGRAARKDRLGSYRYDF